MDLETGKDTSSREQAHDSASADGMNWSRWLTIAIGILLVVVAAILVPVGMLVLKREQPRPGNDDCESAYELPVNGTTVQGTLRGATPDGGGAYCGTSGDPARNIGVWYKFWGAGGAVRVEARKMESDEPTASIAVYSGKCGNLYSSLSHDNRTFEDDYAACRKGSYTFYAEAEQLYYVFVETCPSEQCEFDLEVSVNTVVAPPNDFCQDAVELQTDGIPIEGTLENATWDRNAKRCEIFDNYTPDPGVWYSVMGNGRNNRFLIQGGDGQVNVANVFSGECDNLESVMYTEPGCMTLECSDDACILEDSVPFYLYVSYDFDYPPSDKSFRISVYPSD